MHGCGKLTLNSKESFHSVTAISAESKQQRIASFLYCWTNYIIKAIYVSRYNITQHYYNFEQIPEYRLTLQIVYKHLHGMVTYTLPARE